MKSIRQNVKTAGTNAIKKYLQDKMDPTDKAKLEKNSTNQSQNGEDN